MIGKVRNCLVASLGALWLVAATACGAGDSAASSGGPEAPVTVRLGHFANVTHATAIVGVEKGIFALSLEADKLDVKTFNAGPAAVEALLSGGLDAAYIGPNPAINAFVKSDGKAVRIVSGATSGGAALVVKPTVTDPGGLRGKKVASPQLGGTQDVALRRWLAANGLKTTLLGGGEVSVVPQENAQTLETFKAGQIEGAWVPEPWASRLVQEGGGKVLVDERELWPDGRFVTTHLVVRTEFLKDHPAAVRRLLNGQVAANRFIAEQPDEAKLLVNQGITRITGKGLPTAVIDSAWKNLSFTNDPIAASLATSARHATEVRLLPKADLDGIYDLTLLNEVLPTANQPEVKGL
ncbi:MAG TPA: ABC transporter substrate-binding protein [Acidimicrobiales bacterium]|nr:ABC transporter substrate-binding protein [Acidimicrobiales bacterium]